MSQLIVFAHSSGGIYGIIGTQVFYLAIICVGYLLFIASPNFLKRIMTKNKKMSEREKEEYFQRMWCWIWGVFFALVFSIVATIIIMHEVNAQSARLFFCEQYLDHYV